MLRVATVFEVAGLITFIYMLFFGDDDVMMAASCFPLFAVLLIHLQFPAPGNGVGKQAGALPGLKFFFGTAKVKRKRAPRSTPPADATSVATKAEPIADKEMLPPLGKGGELLPNHAYVVVFFSMTRGSVNALPKVDKLALQLAAAAKSWFHVVLVTNVHASSTPEQIEWFAINKRMEGLAPVALDLSGEAYEQWMSAHNCWISPQAFVVDESGTIVWHGQSNRSALSNTCAKILKDGRARREAAAGQAASDSKKDK